MNKPKFYKSFRSRKHQDKINDNLTLSPNTLKDHDNIILDIGFGTGESTRALQNIHKSYLVCGLEAYKLGINKLVNENILTHYGDALEFLEQIENNTIAKIYMLFPDPWQKKKHRKRRLFNEYTFDIIKRVLIKKGMFHFTSDNINYALEAKNIIHNSSRSNIGFSRTRGSRPITKYEKKALTANRFIFDLIYTNH